MATIWVAMADAATAANAPTTPAMWAGYVNGRFQSYQGLVQRFGPRVVAIDVANTGVGSCLDVEQGDATPADVPGWAQSRRPAGVVHPWVYVSEGNWAAAKAACASAGVAEPWWWIAWWTHFATATDAAAWAESQPGVIAVQWMHNVAPGYDLSAVLAEVTASLGIAAPAPPPPPAPSPAPTPAPTPAPEVVTVQLPVIVPKSPPYPSPWPATPTVEVAQHLLNDYGYGPITTDGKPGQETGNAIARMEQAHGITTGNPAGQRILGKLGWAALLGR